MDSEHHVQSSEGRQRLGHNEGQEMQDYEKKREEDDQKNCQHRKE